MFEELQQEEKELKEMRQKQIWISAIIVLALVVIGGAVFLLTKPFAKKAPATAETSAPAVKETAPDPARDLQVVRAVMGKDVTGVRVMWSVLLRNKSSAYTYSDVQYEARFLRPDGSVMAVSRGTIPCNLAPGDEEKIPDFMGGIYDASASTYNFVLVGAKATPAQ
jgi:hypothetical protein